MKHFNIIHASRPREQSTERYSGHTHKGGMLTDLEATSGVKLEVALEVFHVEAALGGFPDLDDVGATLPPRKDVGVVLKRSDEYNRPSHKPLSKRNKRRKRFWDAGEIVHQKVFLCADVSRSRDAM